MMNGRHQRTPSSPTISSISSSDLDTESTGSFFHEKTTTLGTLMGVRPRLPPTPRTARHLRTTANANATTTAAGSRGGGSSGRRTSWWRLCRDTTIHRSRSTAHSNRSLGDFLQVERRSIVDEYLDGGVGGGLLFVDGRVVPPAQPPISASSSSSYRLQLLGSRTGSGA